MVKFHMSETNPSRLCSFISLLETLFAVILRQLISLPGKEDQQPAEFLL